MFKTGIIGGGPAGCFCACHLNGEVIIFEQNEPLKTLLYTGGGRCNLANAIYDFKELAKNYPRGEKFLYSVFSKFSTQDSLDFFKSIGVSTYTQSDNRIFPVSDDAKTVRYAILNKLRQNGVKFVRQKAVKLEKKDKIFIVNDEYKFDKIVISTGGHAGYEIAKSLGHTIVEPRPSLTGLITKEKYNLDGVSLKNIDMKILNYNKYLNGDLLFTKNGISGPLAFIVSSLFAREDYSEKNPIYLELNFHCGNLLELLNNNGKKDVKNVVSVFVPKSLAEYICKISNTDNKKCYEINKEKRLILEKYLNNFPITIVGHEKHGEIVTSGGISLKEINSKTMESKLIDGLYFCGEIIDADGFCGGFNLQNAWSTGYVCACDINSCYNEF